MDIHVNGATISADAVNLESANYRNGSIEQRQHHAAVALTIRELLRQRAAALRLSTPASQAKGPDAEIDSAIDALLDREVELPEPDEASCRRYFEQNRTRFRTPDTLWLRHILLAAPPDDLAARAGARDRAEDLIRELLDHPARFPDLAGRHSDCPSGKQGGELGSLHPDELLPELSETLERLTPGLAPQPVESRYGFHLFEVLDRRPGRQHAYEEAASRIREYLSEQVRRRAVSQYIRVLAAEAEIDGIDLGADNSPLMQ